jgi:hypothetical protein
MVSAESSVTCRPSRPAGLSPTAAILIWLSAGAGVFHACDAATGADNNF